MITILGMFKIIPRWAYELVIGLALSLGLLFALGAHERGIVQARWDAASAAQAIANKAAADKRADDNKQIASIQVATSLNIQKDHENEIATLNTRIANLGRLRIGAKFCSSVAGQADTQSTASSNGPDSAGRVLSPSVDEAVKRLIMESEEAAASGRAAQKFIRENGMAQ